MEIKKKHISKTYKNSKNQNKQSSFRSGKKQALTSTPSNKEKDELKKELTNYCIGLCQKMTGLENPRVKAILDGKNLF